MKYIKFFKDINRQDVKLFGAKVATLGDMMQSGFLVPNGFGISIEAHREFGDKSFSEEFIKELDTAFAFIEAKRVAVRSSAIAEDSEAASWAGQLETMLNVEKNGLEAAIRECWSSIESEHAQNYAKDKNAFGDDLLVGVGVQTMIASEVSGVMFTVNPVTKNRKEIVIESAYGLGETVVQGIVSPDNFLVGKRDTKILQFNINIKDKMAVFHKGATEIIDVPLGKSDRATLGEAQIKELARVGKSIEKKYRQPQDIEWAYSNKRFYIIQARPVTTL